MTPPAPADTPLPVRRTATLERRLMAIHFALFTAAIVITITLAWRDLYVLPNSNDPEERSKTPEQHLWTTVLKSVVPLALIDLTSWLLIRRTFRPIKQLTDAAEALSEENLAAPLPTRGRGDEVDRLATVLNRLTARLDESFQRIRGFTLHASHELKTPLTILRAGFERALLDKRLSDEQRDQLLTWQDETDRLDRIVSGLTLLTRADARQVELQREPVALDAIVRDLVEDFTQLGQAAGVQAELAEASPVMVNADRHRLRQLLLNLADNALKYNHEGGRIVFRVGRRGQDAVFSIANTGLGIPPESLPHIFERFYRGPENLRRRIDGSGLGLSIARWVAEAHGGSLSAQSADGWTTFTLKLPAAD